MCPRRHLHLERGEAREGNVMTKRIEIDDTGIEACARQQEEDDRIQVTPVDAKQERRVDEVDTCQTGEKGEIERQVADTAVLEALERCVFVLYKISVFDTRAIENAGDVARCCLDVLKKRGMEDDWYEWLDE